MGTFQAYLFELISNHGRRTVNLAYNVLQRYDNYNDTILKQKLSILAQQASHRCPRFTAWGYFEINHKMLFTLTNLTLTYVIVLVQLKLPMLNKESAN